MINDIKPISHKQPRILFQETTPPIPELTLTNETLRKSLKTCELVTVLYFTIDLFLRGEETHPVHVI